MGNWVYDLIYFSAVFGPAGYLLFRYHLSKSEPSVSALVLTLVWTYVMLFMQFNSRTELKKDYTEACQQLEKLLQAVKPDEMENPDMVAEWQACYRQSDEYFEGKAESDERNRDRL